MRRFYSSALAGAILLVGGGAVRADWDYWGIDINDNVGSIYTIDSSTGISTFRSKFCGAGAISSSCSGGWYIWGLESESGNLQIKDPNGDYFEIDQSSWTVTDKGSRWDSNMDETMTRALITKSTSTGITSIGANSLKLQETAGAQKMWATNSSGEIAPINITNGTKLLINGRDVEQAIDNVGALSAALTGLPTVPQDSPMACGIGTGTHSNNVAFSGGCASRINEKLAFNVAASFVPGQSYQGNFDSAWSGRAGFVFKLGKISKTSLVSSKRQKELQQKVDNLNARNTSFENKNKELEARLSMQNKRLEKLERIALAYQKDQKTAFSFLNGSNLVSSMKSFFISSK